MAKKDTSIPLDEAVSFFMISEKAITMTGIFSGDLLIGKALKPSSKKKKQSIYRCQHCGYLTEQKGQGATHVWSAHLSHCLQCRLCHYHTYRSVDFKPHLKKHHPSEGNAWYEPLPDLGHLVTTEVNADELVVGIKKEESDNDSDAPDLDTDQFRLLGAHKDPVICTIHAKLVVVFSCFYFRIGSWPYTQQDWHTLNYFNKYNKRVFFYNCILHVIAILWCSLTFHWNDWDCFSSSTKFLMSPSFNK